MCWSGEASATLAAAGFLGTAYGAWRREPAALWVTLGYFSLMEALQAFTYSVIDQCSLPSNQVATMLACFHIIFQPFFITAISLHFINAGLAKKIEPFAYVLCFVNTLWMLLQLYPFAWAGHCKLGEPICGEMLCSVRGNWHIAWSVPRNGMLSAYPTYFIVGFLMPLLYGSWRFMLFIILSGPVLAQLSTNNPNEWPAIWCILSVVLLLIVINTPVRSLMYNRHYWFWHRLAGDE